MKLHIALLAVPFLILGCSGGGGGETGNDANACNIIGLQAKNAKIINGTTCADPIGSSVVRLVSVNPDGSNLSTFCTGTLIESATVLTAAHCFQAFASTGKVFGVVAGESGNLVGAYIAGGAVAPGYRFDPAVDRLFNDVGVVKLDRALSSPVMPILISRAPAEGEPGYVFGFGRTVEGDATDPVSGLTLQGGTMTVREVTPNHLFVIFEGDGVNVCNGDSGGPLVVEVNGQPAVAGVVSEGSIPGCVPGDVTTFSNLQSESVLPWLAEQAPSAVIR